MRVFYVTSEVSPYAMSGGLGDVMGALPAEIGRLGVSTAVFLPYYNTIRDEYRREMQHLTDLTFNLSWRSTGASVYVLKKANVEYYFIENSYYFGRSRLYGEYDDAERFAFFSRAVIEYMLASGDIPDILHANDWHAALSIVYLRTVRERGALLSDVRTVFTIHNIEYQGKVPLSLLVDVFGIPERYFGVLEYDGCINLMKAAIVTADFVTTVSESYATELYYDYFSFGLSPIIRSAREKMRGIVNGIDYMAFSPERDPYIAENYGKADVIVGKRHNKAALRRELGLRETSSPIICMVTRLAEGKGIDLLLGVIEELLSLDIQLVILGTGRPDYESSLRSIDASHENFIAMIEFDRALSKRIYASADMLLMPSRSEPCGLAQMIACAYGTVPIVRAVGGLRDTIVPYGEEGANGFMFDNYNAHEMLAAVERAIQVYQDKKIWNCLVLSAINSDFSWDKSAKRYIEIYLELIRGRSA